jgi:hypothetical protein
MILLPVKNLLHNLFWSTSSSPPVFSGVRVTRSLALYVCFVDLCLSSCTFSCGHCVVCSSLIFRFRLPFGIFKLFMTFIMKSYSNRTTLLLGWSHRYTNPVYMSNTGVSYRKQEPFANSWVHPRLFVGSVLLILLALCAVLLCVFTFTVPCCAVRYDFHIKTIFGSSFPPVVSRRARVYLRYMCLFVYSGVQHILCGVFVLFVFVLCTLFCRFLWIVHFW